MQLVVSDTSPIRALAHLGLLGLLPQLYEEVLIPPAVVRELERPRSRATPISVASIGFLRVRELRDYVRAAQFEKEVHEGEAEAIALALEVRADAVLIDEFVGRAVAAR